MKFILQVGRNGTFTGLPTTAGLLDLPEEILVKIMRRLDTKSLFQLYNTCLRLRYIVTLPDVMKVCKLSCSNMASAHYLTFQIFHDVGGHLKELNVSCVPNLEAKFLLDMLGTMEVLRVLDVSYTCINIVDLIKIHRICPTINDITINFDFIGKPYRLLPDMVEEMRVIFHSFKKVHFVGSYESLYHSDLSMALLQYARLSKLQLTITSCLLYPYESYEEVDFIGKFDHIVVYMLNWKFAHPENLEGFYLVSYLDMEKYEWICIEWLNALENHVASSPLFQDFFKEKFYIIPDCCHEIGINVPAGGNLIFMAWNKNATVFDDVFFSSLYDQLFDYFPFYQDDVYDTVEPKKWDWLYVHRVGYPGTAYYLALDDIAKGKDRLKLTVNSKMDPLMYVSLPYDNMYLTRVTFLSLNNILCYGNDFFQLLFTSCCSLETVNFTFEEYSSVQLHYLAETLPLCKTIKNFRLVSPYVNMTSILKSLRQCTTLENVHIVDICSVSQCISLAKYLFMNCPNLYCFVVGMLVTPRTSVEWVQHLNKFRLRYKRFHLYLEVNSQTGGQYSYNPFIDVFNLCPLKPINH